MTDNTEADRLESPARADNADEPENGGGLRAKLSTALDVVVSAVAALLYAFIASGAGVDLALPGVVVGVLVLLGLVDTAAEYLGFNSNDGSTLRGRLHNLALLIVALVPAAVGGIVVTTFGGLLSELVYVAGVGVSAFVWFARLHSSDSVEACINRAAARTGVA